MTMVAIVVAIARASSGTLSSSARVHAARSGESRRSRRSGQTSSSRRTTGSVTTIGFDISERPNITTTTRYRFQCGRLTYEAYAQIVSAQKNVLRTSFLSAIHATDSTWSGCTANTAATNALRPVAPVIVLNNPNK